MAPYQREWHTLLEQLRASPESSDLWDTLTKRVQDIAGGSTIRKFLPEDMLQSAVKSVVIKLASADYEKRHKHGTSDTSYTTAVGRQLAKAGLKIINAHPDLLENWRKAH